MSTIAYRYAVGDSTIEITRHLIGTAYPRNGNVGNPTKYYKWMCRTFSADDTEGIYQGSFSTRADAYERARAKILGIPYRADTAPGRALNVRPYTLVAQEMRDNYKGRTKSD